MVTLAAGLIGYVAWPLARARRLARQERAAKRARPPRLTPAVPGKICPACHREYEAGLQYCPHDARELLAANDPATRAAVPGTTCPTCRRSFDGLKKFCPFDGEELVPLTLAIGVLVIPRADGGRARQDLPDLLAPLRERRDILRPRRLRARLGQLTGTIAAKLLLLQSLPWRAH